MDGADRRRLVRCIGSAGWVSGCSAPFWRFRWPCPRARPRPASPSSRHAGARSYPDQSEGPAGYTEAPVAFRTTDTRPTIAIQADGGTQLQCHFDDVFVTQTCGGPGPGCASVCGSFQPAAPLGPDSDQFSRSHFLAVDLMDADGNAVASMWVNLDVDTTPPLTRLESAAGVLSNDASSATPLRPKFGVQVTDSNSVGTQIDTVACAWGPGDEQSRVCTPAAAPPGPRRSAQAGCRPATGSIASRCVAPMTSAGPRRPPASMTRSRAL